MELLFGQTIIFHSWWSIVKIGGYSGDRSVCQIDSLSSFLRVLEQLSDEKYWHDIQPLTFDAVFLPIQHRRALTCQNILRKKKWQYSKSNIWTMNRMTGMREFAFERRLTWAWDCDIVLGKIIWWKIESASALKVVLIARFLFAVAMIAIHGYGSAIFSCPTAVRS